MDSRKEFEVASLLDNQSFIDWVIGGHNDQYWSVVAAKNKSIKDNIDTAKDIIVSVRSTDYLPVDTVDKSEVWDTINSHISQKTKSSKNRLQLYSIAAGIAVLFVAAVGWNAYFSMGSDQSAELLDSNERWIEYTNDSDTNWPVDLADGSQVILEPQAYLKYPAKFDQKSRKVQLEGDAFFDIAHDTLKPFYVYANEAVIRVLGTSFFVKAEEDDKDVEVIVKTGKVAVYRSKEVKEYQAKKIPEVKPIIVTPNQVATLNKQRLVFNKRLVPTPSLIKALKNIEKIYYEDSSIYEIIEAIESAYGVEIELDKNIKESCRLTTTLTNQPLFEKLKIICDPLGLDYQEKDVKIYIRGDCN